MTFQLNENTVSPRRYGSSTSFSVPSGPQGESPWKTTGAGGAFQFYGNTNSRVTFENNGQFNLGTGDFTIEWWQYGTADNSFPRPWAFGPWPDTQLGVSFEGSFILWCYGSSYPFPLAKPITNTSNHFAVVRSDSIFRVYQNGVEIGNQYNDSAFNLTYDLTLGYEGGTYDSQCFVGTLTNFNVLNYAKYTGDFTPSLTALSIDPSSRLFVPATTAENWIEPYGDYIGTVQAGENTDWVNKSPFKFPAPNPLVTFPYPAAATSNTTYGPRTFLVSEYGSDAAAYAAANAACAQPVYGGWNGDIGGHYYASNCAIVTTTYSCPDGGGLDGNGNCVMEYPAVPVVSEPALTCDPYYGYPSFPRTRAEIPINNTVNGTPYDNYFSPTVTTICVYPETPWQWGNYNGIVTGVPYLATTTSYTCPYGGTYDNVSGNCVY